MMTPEPLYRMMVIDSSEIIAPREDYQRELKSERVKRIVSNFDERIANEPKVSYRDGKYYVFDGQHTIDARKALNGGNDLPILCKVYMGMSEKEEALLFARQTGESARLTPGVRVRAEIFGEDGNAVVFLKANADLGIELDYDQERGHMRIGCIKTAMNAYRRLGEERYDSLYQNYVEQLMTEQEYVTLKARYKAEAEEAERLIAVLEQEQHESKVYTAENRFLTEFRSFMGTDTLTKEMASALIERIYVDAEKNIDIRLRYRDEYMALLNFIEGRTAV